FDRPPPSEIYTLSLHDALPIYRGLGSRRLSGHCSLIVNDLPFRIHALFSPSRQHSRDLASARSIAGRGGRAATLFADLTLAGRGDRKSTRLNSSHDQTSYAVFC